MGPGLLDDQGWRRTNGSTLSWSLVIAVAASTLVPDDVVRPQPLAQQDHQVRIDHRGRAAPEVRPDEEPWSRCSAEARAPRLRSPS